ncbi:hypothetical protein [Candidatus Pelagisphaera phototrophica]|uniref:hypothetical protein n=1 Tax=Candidatus Pelagisphaera phototrophica TaxID=2684113 RepID=UPI0019FD5D18|nr:hypothetical protein [Candidatus Pelagisphaera phototrophica]QXD32996.1 hypothetical protein GA004_04590 [Candidatus Pelagisphaera phototrophica]
MPIEQVDHLNWVRCPVTRDFVDCQKLNTRLAKNVANTTSQTSGGTCNEHFHFKKNIAAFRPSQILRKTHESRSYN